jgi:hypothetical protein
MINNSDFKVSIYHAPIELKGDITPFTTGDTELVSTYLRTICEPKHENDERVILFALAGLIFVEDNIALESLDVIYCLIDNLILESIELIEEGTDLPNLDIHVQEYESYEDAYEVALDMREENKLCYRRGKND